MVRQAPLAHPSDTRQPEMPYLRTRLGRWFYEERGTARRSGDAAIVLLHGLLFDGGMFKGQMEELSAVGRTVAIDGPGHGKSEVPPPFTLEDHADAMLDALGELKIDRALLVGLSWGGMVAMRVALQHPTRVKALVLLDTSAEAEEKRAAVKYRLFVSFGRRFGLPRQLAEAQLANVMFGETTLRERPELVERFVRIANGYPREGLARAALATSVHRSDVSSKIGAIRVPTLVVCGREDRATEPVHSERIARRIAGARLVLLDRCGHSSAIEKPREVCDAIVPFVRDNV